MLTDLLPFACHFLFNAVSYIRASWLDLVESAVGALERPCISRACAKILKLGTQVAIMLFEF